MNLAGLYSNTSRPLYNAVLGKSLTDTTPVTEPVSVAEVKEELMIDFADHDIYLEKLITRCRKAMENYCGLSLVPKTVVAVVKNEIGNIELPYGPVTSVVADIELKDSEGNTIDVDSYTITGIDTKFPVLESLYDHAQLTYEAGYTDENVPDDIKQSLISVVAYCFKNRGDEGKSLSHALSVFCSQHKRGSWLL